MYSEELGIAEGRGTQGYGDITTAVGRLPVEGLDFSRLPLLSDACQIWEFGIVVDGLPFNWPGPYTRLHEADGPSLEILVYEREMAAPDGSWLLRNRWHHDAEHRPESWEWWSAARGWIDVGTTLDPLKGEERKTADQALKALGHHRETRGGAWSVKGYTDPEATLELIRDFIRTFPHIPTQADVFDHLWADEKSSRAATKLRTVGRLFDKLIKPATGLEWHEVKGGG